MNKTNVLRIRLDDNEMDFIREHVDYFFYDSVSGYVRGLIRSAMKEEQEEREVLDGLRT